MEKDQALLTRKEACGMLRICESSLDEAIRRKQIPIVRFARRILIPRLALEHIIASATSNVEGEK